MDKEKRENIVNNILIVVCLLMAAALGLTLLKDCSREETESVTREVVRTHEVKVDTTFVEVPVPRDSAVLRYVTVPLPLAPGADSSAPTCAAGLPQAESESTRAEETRFGIVQARQSADSPDSALVQIPITQKEYADSSYRAWVSGYMASLDSIEIYNRTVLVTEKVTETITKQARRKWGFTVGPTLGAGWNGSHFAPYIGLGLTWGFSF